MKLGMPQLFTYQNLEDNFKLAKKLDLDFIVNTFNTIFTNENSIALGFNGS